MKPDWVDNDIKYQRALVEAKDPTNEAEVKAIYASYGGKLVNEVPEVSEVTASEPVEVLSEVTGTPAEEVKIEEVPEAEIPEGIIEE